MLSCGRNGLLQMDTVCLRKFLIVALNAESMSLLKLLAELVPNTKTVSLFFFPGKCMWKGEFYEELKIRESIVTMYIQQN